MKCGASCLSIFTFYADTSIVNQLTCEHWRALFHWFEVKFGPNWMQFVVQCSCSWPTNCWTSHRPLVWLTTTFCFKDWNTGSVYLDLACSGSPYNSSYNDAFLWHFLSALIFHFSYLWCTTRFCIGALIFSKTSDSSLAYFEHLWGHLLSLLCRWYLVIYLFYIPRCF